MPAAKTKLKAKAKTTSKAPAKTKAKAPAKAKAKAKAPSKKAAPKKSVKLAVVKPQIVAKPVAHAKVVQPTTKETFFERMLRLKAERHASYQKQNATNLHPNSATLPHNHAKFAKFAGPRRRAS